MLSMLLFRRSVGLWAPFAWRQPTRSSAKKRNRLLFDGVNVNDVLMPDRGGGTRLAHETLACWRGGGQARRHDLDSDHAVQFLVVGLHDGAEAPLAEKLQHLVMPQPAERSRLRGRLQDF